MGGKSGARNFGSGRAGEVFRPLLVAGEVVESRHPAMCGHTSPFGNSARGGFQPNRFFQQRSADQAAVNRCFQG